MSTEDVSELEIKKETESKDDSLPIRRERHGNVANLVQRISTYGLLPGGIQPLPQTKNVKKKTKKRQCKVLFEYIPQNEDELELKVGDIIDISEEVEEGWWSGTLNNKLGLFPSNFVKELEVTDDVETQEAQEDSEAVLTGPTSPLPLSLGNGTESAPGSVTQPKKIRGIGFGDIFKEGSVKLRTRTSSSETEEKKPEKPLITQSLGSKTQSVEITKTDTEGKIKAKEYCRTLFAYEGTNEDELTFKEGEIIQLISKETGETGWWKGELNGKEGVFPDNFAVQINELDKDFPPPRVLWFGKSGEDAALGHRGAGGTGGGGGAGARGGLRAVPAAGHQRDARGHRGTLPRARAGLPAEPEQAVGDGQYAHPDKDAGGGLGGERAQPSAESGRRSRGPGDQTLREGGGEGQGDREDGRDAGGAGAADREERVVLKEGRRCTANGFWSTDGDWLTPWRS